MFTLVVEPGEWRINGSSLEESRSIASTIKYLWPANIPADLTVQSDSSRASNADWLLRMGQPQAKIADVIISGGSIGESPGRKVDEVMVRGLPGLTYTFPGGAAVVWQENNNNYGITGNRSVNELLNIALDLEQVDRATWEQRASQQ